MTQTVPDFTQRPIAIGAIGGSGSRVLAQVVHAAGVSLGSNLNSSNDNLEFTTRFKALGIKNVSDVDFTSRLAEFETLSRSGNALCPLTAQWFRHGLFQQSKPASSLGVGLSWPSDLGTADASRNISLFL